MRSTHVHNARDRPMLQLARTGAAAMLLCALPGCSMMETKLAGAFPRYPVDSIRRADLAPRSPSAAAPEADPRVPPSAPMLYPGGEFAPATPASDQEQSELRTA